MAGTFFHIEERRMWIRTSTHTVVYDRDPDYQRFAEDPSGTVKRMLRVWLVKLEGNLPHMLAYLGTVMFYFTDPSFRDLRRLLRFTSRAAKAVGQPARTLRHDLAVLLRKYVHESGGCRVSHSGARISVQNVQGITDAGARIRD
jgi:hypothetical protein